MWQSVVNGQQLKFHLAGINNQNFIMRDEQTGSWWQQISGAAIQGAFKGEKLTDVASEEVSFAVWKQENPNGRVLRPDAKILAANRYESADWETQIGKMPVRIAGEQDKTFEPRALVVGVAINGDAKAFPIAALEKQSPILDNVGGADIIVVLGADKKTARVFERTVDGRTLEFFARPETGEIVDAETASVWDFSGAATRGGFAGKQLKKIAAQKDFWFDWKTYHPNTRVYALGVR